MGLTKSERKMLERLQAKAEEPDPAPIGRNLNVTLDLGSKEQVELAKRYGFLPADDDDTDDDNDEPEVEDTPRRPGFFRE